MSFFSDSISVCITIPYISIATRSYFDINEFEFAQQILDTNKPTSVFLPTPFQVSLLGE